MAAKHRNRQPHAACRAAFRIKLQTRFLLQLQKTEVACQGDAKCLLRLGTWLTSHTTSCSCAQVTLLAAFWPSRVLNRLGDGKFRAFSAGSFPKGEVHPYALELLERQSYPTKHLRSKSWDEFAVPGAEPLDFVFTVCDNAAGEVCPIWPGQPMTAHWGLPDPAAVEGNEAERRLAFAETLQDAPQPDRGLRESADQVAGQDELAESTARDRPHFIVSSSLSRRLAAEAVGSVLLLATVIGSGIMADELAGGNAR